MYINFICVCLLLCRGESVSIDSLGNGIIAVQNLLSLIYNRYEYNTKLGRTFMLIHSNMGKKDWNIQKAIFAKKILSDDSTYKMIFGGSSVTAGHDNNFNQSYPLIVEKRLRPVFRALGIAFDVKNIAQGANDCYPYDLCYETMGGPNADFYAWEQTFNCGREPAYVEVVGRLAAVNGAFYYISASGSGGSKCNASTDTVPYSSETWSPRVAGVQEWRPSPDDLQQVMDDIVKMHSLKSSVGNYESSLSKYTGLGRAGLWLWNDFPKEVCVGLPLASCNGASFWGCNTRFFTKETFVYGNGGGAAHHPTVGTHMLRGELITWLCALPLLDAMYSVQAGLKTSSQEKLLQMFSEELNTLQEGRKVPPPAYCDREPLRCTRKATCFTDFSPHYSNITLRSILIGSTKWTYMKELGVRMGVQRFRSELDAETHPSFVTSLGPEAGDIYFKVKVSSAHPRVAVCAYKMKDAFRAVEFKLDLNVNDDELKDYKSRTSMRIWPDREQQNVHCVSLKDVPPGQHVLGIEAKEKKQTGVTHIITWE